MAGRRAGNAGAVVAVLISGAAVAAGCGDDAAGGPTPDGGVVPLAEAVCLDAPAAPGTCARAEGDYTPAAEDAWPACVSDGGDYVRVEATVSTIARVRAFEAIAALLFAPDATPAPAAFLEARRIYQEDEGLESRVVRRYDPHFAVPEGTDCTQPETPAAYPDYCVGPARLAPLVLDALNRGFAGEAPARAAGTVEGGLLWFLYASTYKEALTCTTTARDCDSAWAYFTGGEPARCGLGLARYVAEVDALAFDRAWDGYLALRCWRDLDDGEVATQLELRDLARAQADRATLDGLAAVVRDRALRLEAARVDTQPSAEATRERLEGLLVALTPALRRAVAERNPAAAAALDAALAPSVDPTAIRGVLDAVFLCP